MTISIMHKVLQIAMYAMLANRSNLGEPTIFFDFSGHVNWFEVRIFRNGWRISANPDVRYEIHPAEYLSEVNFYGDSKTHPTDDLLELLLGELKLIYKNRRDKSCKTTD